MKELIEWIAALIGLLVFGTVLGTVIMLGMAV